MDEALSALLTQADQPVLRSALRSTRSHIPAQVIGTGPTVRFSTIPALFESLMHRARHALLISTPYYVPDEPLIVPARNVSWIVAAASRSYYDDLYRTSKTGKPRHGGRLELAAAALE